MEYLLVIYFLISGEWVRGDEIEGWGSLAYPTEEICLERKARAEQIHAELKRINPGVYDKRIMCEPRETDTDD